MSLYGVLKFVHVLSVVAWVGGSIAMSVIGGLLLRSRDRATLGGYVPQMFAYSRRIGAPASVLVLITGIAMLAVGKIGFMAPWVVVGYAGLVLHFIIGSTLVQRGIEGIAT